MGRPEKPIDPGNGLLAVFALDLRTLRQAVPGGLTYAQMSKIAHYSSPTLSEAARGNKAPTWPVTRAYVQACGVVEHHLAGWEVRWKRACGGRPSVAGSRHQEADQHRDRTDSDTGRAGGESPDPDQIRTTTELARALRQLKGDRSYRDLTQSAEKLVAGASEQHRDPQWDVATPLNRGTMSDWFSGRSRPTSTKLATFLRVCKVPGDQIPRWFAALDLVQQRDGRDPRRGNPAGLSVELTDQKDESDHDLNHHSASPCPPAAPSTWTANAVDQASDLRQVLWTAVRALELGDWRSVLRPPEFGGAALFGPEHLVRWAMALRLVAGSMQRQAQGRLVDGWDLASRAVNHLPRQLVRRDPATGTAVAVLAQLPLDSAPTDERLAVGIARLVWREHAEILDLKRRVAADRMRPREELVEGCIQYLTRVTFDPTTFHLEAPHGPVWDDGVAVEPSRAVLCRFGTEVRRLGHPACHTRVSQAVWQDIGGYRGLYANALDALAARPTPAPWVSRAGTAGLAVRPGRLRAWQHARQQREFSVA